MATIKPKTAAFLRVKDRIPPRMEYVLQAIKKIQPCTYKNVADELGEPAHLITNRISELVKVGMVTTDEFTYPDGRQMSLFRTCTIAEAKAKQKVLFREYSSERVALIKDLAKLDEMSENTKKLLQNRISFCDDKLKFLTRFKV